MVVAARIIPMNVWFCIQKDKKKSINEERGVSSKESVLARDISGVSHDGFPWFS